MFAKNNRVYSEDYDVAKQFNTEEEKNDFYLRIKSGAETGWDFSSKWFITANGSFQGEYLKSQVNAKNLDRKL